MATKRLCDHDKRRLTDRMETLVYEPARCHLLQLTKEQQQEFVAALIPAPVLEAFHVVQQFDNGLVSARDTVSVLIKSHDPRPALADLPISITVDLKMASPMPRTRYVTSDTSLPHYGEIEAWARNVVLLRHRAREAYKYASEAIQACTSIGQVKRVLPGLEQYAPSDVAASLANAERRSRVPSGFEKNYTQFQNLMEMLALGQLCPTMDFYERHKLAEVTTERAGWED